MTVRRVLPTDVAGLSWLDGGTRNGLVAAADAGGARSLVLGETVADGLVGVLAVDLPPWRERTVPWLWLVEVHPERRGEGIGTHLLTEAHRQLAMSGHRVVELSVDRGNPRAAALYRRLGYVPAGDAVEPGPGGPEAVSRMRRTLRP